MSGFKEMGALAPMLSIGRGEVGAFVVGRMINMRFYMDRNREVPKKKWLFTLLLSDHKGATAQAKDQDGKYQDIDVVNGEQYTIQLGTVLEQRMADVMATPDKWIGVTFRLTYLGNSEKKKPGQKPAKLYRVEADESTREAFDDLGGDVPGEDEE